MPPLPVNNQYDVLEVEEIDEFVSDTSDTPETKAEPSKKERRLPRWERRLPKKLTIAATEPGERSCTFG